MTQSSIPTRVAHGGHDDNRYFGYSTFAELLGDETYTGLNVMAVAGRRVDRASREMLDDLAVITTVADPRIWPLKLTRVVASYGGTLAAFAAGQLCMEGDLIGPWSTRFAAELWAELRNAIDDDCADDTRVQAEMTSLLARRKRLVGYGVPFQAHDKRFFALRQRVEQRGLQGGPHWRLQEAFSRRVEAERGLGPNILAGASALLLDLGFSVAETPALMTFLAQHNFAANAIEGARQAPAVLRSLPVDTATYVGEPPRESPRAIAARRGADSPSVAPVTG